MPPHNVKEEVILVIGTMGSDAGYSVLTPHGVIHVPGNNPMARQAFEGLLSNFKMLQKAAMEQPAAVNAANVAQRAQ